MVDISMCPGGKCPLRHTCYRCTATPSEFWQSYIGAYYKDGKCDHYWPTEPDVKRKTRRVERAKDV